MESGCVKVLSEGVCLGLGEKISSHSSELLCTRRTLKGMALTPLELEQRHVSLQTASELPGWQASVRV
jgi:hypothetical protein